MGSCLRRATSATYSGDLLVGNFGDGRINAFTKHPGGAWRPAGRCAAATQPLEVDGLWALEFGHGVPGSTGPTNSLFFTAGPDDESNGLFGSIRAR